jgi:hypothetical protein
LPESHLLYGAGSDSSFSVALARIWNEFVDWAELPKHYRTKVNESAFSLMRRLGVSDAVAQLAVKHIPDLVEELAAKTPFPGSGKIGRFLSERILRLFFPRPR